MCFLARTHVSSGQDTCVLEPGQKRFSQKFLSNIFAGFFFFDVEKWNVGDHLKRISPKFEAERSHPRGVNGRSKFRIFQKCETLNGRLPPELRSYSRETWGKPVSDDSAHFVFWRRTFFGGIFRDGLLDDQRFDGLDRRYFQSAHGLRFEPAVCGLKAF